MPVGKEKLAPVRFQQRIVRHYGEFQNHLVYFAVTISAHAKQLLFDAVEHSKHFLRRIPVGEIVARPVVEQIPEQHQLIRAFAFKRFQKPFAPKRRAVNIRCNHNFHKITYLSTVKTVRTSLRIQAPASIGSLLRILL